MSKKQALSKEELKKINGGTPGTGDIATGPKGSGKKNVGSYFRFPCWIV